MEIMGYKLFGGGDCPEQYDVFDENNNQVGYLRLRHGRFTAEVPDVGGALVYTAHPEGDGMFDEDERNYYLQNAVEAIKLYLNSKCDEEK